MALNNVPLSGQTLNFTQPLIEDNFNVIDATFSINHQAYDSASDSGKHTIVELLSQVSIPTIPGANLTEGILYNYQYTKGNTQATNFYELWYVNNGRLGYPITGGFVGTPGWAYLGGGSLAVWGQSSGTGTVVINPGTSPAGLPTFTQIYSAQITTWMNGVAPSNTLARLLSIGTSTIDVYCSDLSGNSATADFMYYIIGSTASV